MCGLFGFSFDKANLPSKGERKRLATCLAHYMDQRGGQAWGVYANGRIHKGLGDSANSMHLFKRADVLMGHTRYATHGDKDNLDHAHPFREGSVILSHNGVISNHRDLNTKHGRKHEVDSQHLLSHLIEGKPFTEIEAYGAITWLDETVESRVNIATLAEKGDMAIAKLSDGGVVWASTRQAVKEACAWADLDIEHFYEVVPGKVYMALAGKLYEDTKHPSLLVSDPVTYHDWRSGYSHWFTDTDTDAAGVWDRVWSKPTPPSIGSVPTGWALDDALPALTDEDLEAIWQTELEVEEAKKFIEDYTGVGPAAFDGMSPDEVLDTALDLGWTGLDADWGDEKATG